MITNYNTFEDLWNALEFCIFCKQLCCNLELLKFESKNRLLTLNYNKEKNLIINYISDVYKKSVKHNIHLDLQNHKILYCELCNNKCDINLFDEIFRIYSYCPKLDCGYFCSSDKISLKDKIFKIDRQRIKIIEDNFIYEIQIYDKLSSQVSIYNRNTFKYEGMYLKRNLFSKPDKKTIVNKIQTEINFR